MITVFTPTFNRAYIIENLYKSLLAQTDKNFEWVVVDDGSSDNTSELFEKFLANDNGFNIEYKIQQNGGKHRAINYGVSLAKGELFFIVDSDDYLTADAIEKINAWVKTLDADKKWAGVSGVRGYDEKTPIGQAPDQDFIDATNLERAKKNLLGDKAEVYFTEVLKAYPFPEFENENFITEEVVWNKIAYDGYKLRWYSDIIYICDYIADGLTKSGDAKYIKNPQGTLYWARGQMQYFAGNKRAVYSAINRYYTAVKGSKSKKEICADLGISRAKLFIATTAVKLGRIVKKILRKG
ncbi:MAG: glycosyltransferase family 2 protein [Clostridia bacterium]|nr:glycosyltransferase family 2 protein [Clostridia bacterium]